MEYRGIEYSLKKITDTEWQWKFYPPKAMELSSKDGTEGSKGAAEEACKEAIDVLLDQSVD